MLLAPDRLLCVIIFLIDWCGSGKSRGDALQELQGTSFAGASAVPLGVRERSGQRPSFLCSFLVTEEQVPATVSPSALQLSARASHGKTLGKHAASANPGHSVVVELSVTVKPVIRGCCTTRSVFLCFVTVLLLLSCQLQSLHCVVH